ncbi:uncharacterized protein LOC115796684 isoform X1 [Archocentrus centrarchus]|uniref:uncharacterized protein LOC115796684 isoform X1 n=2 Tax=Archocentrus centrarchus TaxID=63155 RepID=UPI0011EA0D3A|nr:uncharacterized protein LOC115796684 isoform X1 [Archocentrus centrarchus]
MCCQSLECVHFCSGEMLVQVEHQAVQKWVRVPVTDDCYDYLKFIQEVHAKFNLASGVSVDLKDSSGVDVDADIFDELLRSATVSFKVVTERFVAPVDQSEVTDASFSSEDGSFSSVESPSSASSSSTVITENTKAQRRRLVEGPPDSEMAKNIVYVALHQKPGGEDVIKEYNKTRSLSDPTRKKLVNILVADMIESHGRVPPVNIRITYALGIVTLFPSLKDNGSPTGYEHYYDPLSGQGYLAYRLKTVQRNTASDFKRSSKSAHQGGPRTLRETLTSEQLFGDGCKEAMSMMKHSSDQEVVREKMKATFKHRQNMLHDLDQSSLILDHFPRFLDTPGLIEQDFIMLFGEDISGKFIARWPTFYKPRVTTVSKSLRQSAHLDDLLSTQEESSDYEWDSDLAAILLLVHLLPPTAKGKRQGKISAPQAADRVIKFMKVGTSMATFLAKVGSAQPFLLCVGEKKSRIQKFYIILDQKPIPCVAQTAVAAFDELFKAHFVFAVSYDATLLNFYTFIQTTVYGIDVATTKESPRVKEIRVRINNT